MVSPASSIGPDRITVLACYDTMASGREAMELMDRFNRRPDLPVRLDVRLWRWDVLAQPEVGEVLAGDVRDADLLVVVQAGNGDSPDDLVGLVRDWSEAHRGSEAALLVLQTGRDGPGPLARTLHQLVQAHGLAVLNGGPDPSHLESERLAA